jgi:hypothetical protein
MGIEGTRWVRWVAGIGLVAILAVYLHQVWIYRVYTNDDAYISFRYSRFLALGRGPYFNEGEHVEGYTNLSLMVLMAGVARWGGDAMVPVAAKLVGVLSGAVAILLVFVATRSLLRNSLPRGSLIDGLSLAAAGLVAVSPGFAVNATSGLETSLYSAFLIGAVTLGVAETMRSRWMGSGLAFAAAVLTRPEGIALAFVFYLTQAILGVVPMWREPGPRISRIVADQRLRAVLSNVSLVAAITGSHLLFRLVFYDGEWLPNTYYAKAGGFWGYGAGAYVWEALSPTVFGIAGLALCLAGLLFFRPRMHTAGLSVAAVAAAGWALPFVTGTDWMLGWRLVIPYLPMAACTLMLGWAWSFQRLPRAWIPIGLVFALACVPASWALQHPTRQAFRYNVELRARGYETGHAALADWLRNHAASDGDAAALMDIGIVGYRCIDQRIIDVTGLTDRFIARSPGPFLDKEYDPGYILDQHPRFIVLTLTAPGRAYERPEPDVRFSFWIPAERRLYEDARFQRSYARQRRPKSDSDDWLEALAARLGAERIFEHAHPGKHYLLAVFERKPEG